MQFHDHEIISAFESRISKLKMISQRTKICKELYNKDTDQVIYNQQQQKNFSAICLLLIMICV